MSFLGHNRRLALEICAEQGKRKRREIWLFNKTLSLILSEVNEKSTKKPIFLVHGRKKTKWILQHFGELTQKVVKKIAIKSPHAIEISRKK